MKINKKVYIPIIIAVVLLLLAGIYVYSQTQSLVVVKVGDSAAVADKIKKALISGGSVEFNEGEANILLPMLFKNSVVKDKYIKIYDNKLHIYMPLKIWGQQFVPSVSAKLSMSGKNIALYIDSVYLGRLGIPKRLAMGFIKKHLPKDAKINGTSILLGNKISGLEISSISIENNMLKLGVVPQLQLQSETQQSTGKTGSSSSSSASGSKSNSGATVSMLKKTNSELAGVLSEVTSDQAKEWVSSVISINSEMIQNSNGNYKSQINSTRSKYNSFSKSVRNEIKGAAADNLDMDAAMYLARVYGL